MRAGVLATKVVSGLAALGKVALVIMTIGFIGAVLVGGVKFAFSETLGLAFDYPLLGGLTVVGILAVWIERNPDLLERDGLGVLVGLAVAVLCIFAAWWFGTGLLAVGGFFLWGIIAVVWALVTSRGARE